MTPLERIIQELHIRMSLMDAGKFVPATFPPGTRAWICRLYREGSPDNTAELRVPFFTRKDVPKPTAADVLSTLAIEASQGDLPFRDFLAEHGGKGALTMYNKCRTMADSMRAFLGRDYDRVANAEHEG